jgi:hypothetical protein
MSAGERLYRLLLRLYPADFRAQFGSELAQWYLDRRRHESAVRVWVDVARDLFSTAPKQQVTAVSSDLRYALRSVRRAPALAFAVVGTVALAVTANTSMFSVVNAVLLRPLPFSDTGRLVQVAEKNDRLNLPSFGAGGGRRLVVRGRAACVLGTGEASGSARSVDRFAAGLIQMRMRNADLLRMGDFRAQSTLHIASALSTQSAFRI